MKTYTRIALLLIAASPVAVFASSNDSKIEDAASGSYNYRSVLNNQVTAKSNDGVVTLTGTVEDQGQKALAEDTVSNLPGVVSVRNEITLKPSYAEHSDGWIALKIRGRLLVMANVSATDTTVVVNDGRVVLSGTAKNTAQKELTAQYAKDVDGVRSITNEIEVKNSPDSTVAENIDDASITSEVKYELLSHKATSAVKTSVSTSDGIVRVTGEAANDAERSLVTKLAQDVRGAKSVTNDMTIRS
jgi:hyperosmotically inducible protein